MAEKVASVASEKTLAILGKIKAKQWKAMGKTVEQMREFAEEGGMGAFVGDLKDTLSLQVQDALAPLKNEVNEALMEALAPIMPTIVQFLTDGTDFLVIGIKSWEAILTGKWDEFIKWMEANTSAELKKWRRDVQNWWADMMKGWEGFWDDLEKGTHGFFADIGKGWSGFWRDLGWK